MLQVDGSPHDSLEGRGPSLCLIGAIDDATGKVVGALFVEAESLGSTSVYSQRSSTSTDCRSQSTPTVTRSFGPIENLRLRNS